MADFLGPAGGIIGGIIGGSAAGGDRGHQQALIDEAVAAMQGVKTPTDLANQIYFQQLRSAGQLTPAQEQAINAGPAMAGQVQANPQMQAAQMQALNALKGLTQTGMTSADRARLNQVQQQMATQAEGQRQAVLQNFAQRGLAGSGNELLSQLTASQNAANQANQQGLGVAGQAQQNALNALGQYGSQAGAMNTQQFGQQMQTAEAQDALNRFNTQNQLSQQARNVANRNAAQQYNLQNQQNMMNANTNLYNQGLLMQRQGEQTQFQDALQRAQGISGAAMGGAKAYGDMAGNIAQNWTNIGTGLGGLAGQAVSALGSAPTAMFGGGSEAAGGLSADAASQLMEAGAALAHGGEVGYSKGGVTPSSYDEGGQTYSFGGHVPKEEDKYVRTYGNGYDAPNNYASGGAVAPAGAARPGSFFNIGNTMGGSTQSPQPSQQPGLINIGNWGEKPSGMFGGAIGGIQPNSPFPQPDIHPGGLPPKSAPNMGPFFGGIGSAIGGTQPRPQPKMPVPNANHGPVFSFPRGTIGGMFAEGGTASYSHNSESHLPMIKALAGGTVPGEAKVPGDSYENDTVHARVSPGEIIIPRSIVESPNAGILSKHFVEGELKKHGQ